jgi:hypothetical protein
LLHVPTACCGVPLPWWHPQQHSDTRAVPSCSPYTNMLQLSVCLSCSSAPVCNGPCLLYCACACMLWLLHCGCAFVCAVELRQCFSVPRKHRCRVQRLGQQATWGLLTPRACWHGPTVAVYAYATDADSNLLGRPGCVSSSSSSQPVACASTPHKYSWCRVQHAEL